MHECVAAGSASCSLACRVPQSVTLLGPPAPLPCCKSFLPWLPVSAPPTSLDECFFFISLVVGLPYRSIFCQFWLFFVFKLLLSFFWLHKEAQYVYLHLHLGQIKLSLKNSNSSGEKKMGVLDSEIPERIILYHWLAVWLWVSFLAWVFEAWFTCLCKINMTSSNISQLW